MAQAGTSRIKFNPPLGQLPALQYLLPAQLSIDHAYQRTIEDEKSQRLIRRIAQFWNWDLCQPLVVSRRDDGALYVIDGQHRLEAARLRGDIAQLPAVVVSYPSPADEAASFVHINEARRPLTRLEVFKAAVASGDRESCAILASLEEAGLSLAGHWNYISWKPGMVANVAGLQEAWRRHGETVFALAAKVMALAWPGVVLRYCGTVWPGIVALCASEASEAAESLAQFVGSRSQSEWKHLVMLHRAEAGGLRFAVASEQVFLQARVAPPPAPSPRAVQPPRAPSDGPRWCDQCEERVSLTTAALCKSRFCKVRPLLKADELA